MRSEISYLEYKHNAIIAKAKRELQEFEGRLHAPLLMWASERLKDAKRKYVDLLFGRLQFRTNPARVSIDQSLTSEWFEKQYPEHIRSEVRLVLDKRGLESMATNHLKETGELLPGFVIVPETELFFVTTKQGDDPHDDIFREEDKNAFD